MDLILVRHGATRLNEEARYQGFTNAALSPSGRDEVRRLCRGLPPAAQRPQRLWTSPARRARETARLLLPHLRPDVEPRLRELDFGRFEALTYGEAAERDGAGLAAWLDDPWHRPPPEGESLASLMARVDGWLRDLPASGVHVAVTHGGPVAACLHLLLGLPWREALPLRPRPGRLVRICRDGEVWRLCPPLLSNPGRSPDHVAS